MRRLKHRSLLKIINQVIFKECFLILQVFVGCSGRETDVSSPFGYLKASTNLSCVNLFVMPYNYPVLMPLLEELLKKHNKAKPPKEWRQAFDGYLNSMPAYYGNPLKRALQVDNILILAFDGYLTN